MTPGKKDMTKEQQSLQWLSAILDILRKECPWDSVQTINSLRYLTIEEVYELSDAIAASDYDEMRKELGDLFMHLLFYAKIADDEGRFTTADVIDGICCKLISRHPHIALPDRDGELHAASSCETPKWEQVKMKEGRQSVMEGVPVGLPPLVKAIRMQEKAAGVGFEFQDKNAAHRKTDEEYRELLAALRKRDNCNGEEERRKATAEAEEELGDLLFALVKWSRMEGLNADDAMTHANLKFKQRFGYIEQQAHLQNKNISDLSSEEMMRLWNKAKKQ